MSGACATGARRRWRDGTSGLGPRVPVPVPGCTFSVCVCGRALLTSKPGLPTQIGHEGGIPIHRPPVPKIALRVLDSAQCTTQSVCPPANSNSPWLFTHHTCHGIQVNPSPSGSRTPEPRGGSSPHGGGDVSNGTPMEPPSFISSLPPGCLSPMAARMLTSTR